MYSSHVFLFKIFLAPQRITRDPPKSPRQAPFSAFQPVSHPVFGLRPTRATGPLESKKSPRFAGMVMGLPFWEAVKPPLLVPVFRNRLLGEFCDGQPIGFDPSEDRLDDVRSETVQGKDAADVAGFQAELL